MATRVVGSRGCDVATWGVMGAAVGVCWVLGDMVGVWRGVSGGFESARGGVCLPPGVRRRDEAVVAVRTPSWVLLVI